MPLLPAPPPQIDPRALSLLEHAQQTLDSLPCITAKARYKVSLSLGKARRVDEATIRLLKPNYAVVSTGRKVQGNGAMAWQVYPRFQTVSADGRRIWRSFESLHEYESGTDDPAGGAIPLDTGDLLDGFFSHAAGPAAKFKTLDSRELIRSAAYLKRTWHGGSYKVAKFTYTQEDGRTIWNEELFVGRDGLIHRVLANRDDGAEYREAVLLNVNLSPGVTKSGFNYAPPPDYHAEDQDEQRPATLPVGSPAPAYSAQDYDDKKTAIADFRGKPLVLVFWATWCQPALEAFPEINKMATDPNLTVAAVDVGDSTEVFKAWVRRNPGLSSIRFLSDPLAIGRNGSNQIPYRVSGLPTLFVIDARGTVAASFVGYSEEQEQKLEAVVKVLDKP